VGFRQRRPLKINLREGGTSKLILSQLVLHSTNLFRQLISMSSKSSIAPLEEVLIPPTCDYLTAPDKPICSEYGLHWIFSHHFLRLSRSVGCASLYPSTDGGWVTPNKLRKVCSA
jgi:hypothetical protein